jgi:hypothetical protein
MEVVEGLSCAPKSRRLGVRMPIFLDFGADLAYKNELAHFMGRDEPRGRTTSASAIDTALRLRYFHRLFLLTVSSAATGSSFSNLSNETHAMNDQIPL